jgi:hypothetical protein
MGYRWEVFKHMKKSPKDMLDTCCRLGMAFLAEVLSKPGFPEMNSKL